MTNAPPGVFDPALVACFRGIEMPQEPRARLNEISHGRVFLRQLALQDRVFGIMLEDHKKDFDSALTAESGFRNWKILGLVLDDLGMEISDEVSLGIIAGNVTLAVQLATEITTLNTAADAQRSVIRRVGQAVPTRQRIDPFLGQLPSGASVPVPTRLFISDPQRFMKKRTYLADQVEKLSERLAKLARIKAQKEREASKIAAEAKKSNDQAAQQVAQEQYIRETILLSRQDPEKLAEKARRTELLAQLELLENAYSADQRRLNKLKRGVRPESPKGNVRK